MSSKEKDLSDLILRANKVTDETLTIFGKLAPQQLNWKPDINQWSIAQCFEHLRTANEAYFPILKKVLNGEKKNTFWESMPLLPMFFGKMLIKSVAPESKSKLKAPKVFYPSNSNIEGDIIHRFVEQQNQMVKCIKATESLDLDKIIITSPVTNLITYSLMDAYRVIVNHEERHFLQAKRVFHSNGFPT